MSARPGSIGDEFKQLLYAVTAIERESSDSDGNKAATANN
jgi:hypothetical protein